jgi:hypothetical protein
MNHHPQLAAALWLVGNLWITGYIAYLNDAPGTLVAATFLVGLAVGAIELVAGYPED